MMVLLEGEGTSADVCTQNAHTYTHVEDAAVCVFSCIGTITAVVLAFFCFHMLFSTGRRRDGVLLSN